MLRSLSFNILIYTANCWQKIKIGRDEGRGQSIFPAQHPSNSFRSAPLALDVSFVAFELFSSNPSLKRGPLASNLDGLTKE